MDTLDRAAIEQEVRRLSPWYYRYDLGGVLTDITPPCDHHGHRTVSLPPMARDVLADRTVLDVACNEGGYSFAALAAGARGVVGFDVRAVNVEKARFVAQVKGHAAHTEFHVSSCDEWLRDDPQPVDHVFLCGLLYHLVEPWRTIEEYCALAREGVFVTCVLHGGEDGYTPFPEQENIAASEDPDELSMMPSTTRTLVREFEKHGFLPGQIGENRSGIYWGGCSLLLRRLSRPGLRWSPHAEDGDLELHALPSDKLLADRKGTLNIVLYNWLERERPVSGRLAVRDAQGRELAGYGDQEIVLPARVSADDGSSTESTSVAVPIDASRLEAPLRIEVTVREAGATQPVATRVVHMG